MDLSTQLPMLIGMVVAGLLLLLVLWIIFLRRVVPTNEVHIVQTADQSRSYGTGLQYGNTYYEFPIWMPVLGVSVSRYPVSVFTEELIDYEAYDQGRLPFVIDVKAFFRIEDSNVAAKRVATFDEMRKQMNAILQGCIRSILAMNDIETIMQDRAKFGEEFTRQVDDNLKSWGVVTVKSVELMDIRDSQGSNVIKNIMEKKKSEIEMQSRIEVAANKRKAEMAEIDASRDVELQRQVSQQQVGLRTAEKEREVGIAKEQSVQSIKEQERITKEKTMAVEQVAQVKQAEINKEVQIVNANQQKETAIINAEAEQATALINSEAEKQSVMIKAEGEKQSTMAIAAGLKEAKVLESKGIEAEGHARAEAAKAMQLASVQAEITLAEKIGENESYQKYLISLEQVKVMGEVGKEQAKALEKAQVKIIANAGGTVSNGISKVTDLFSANGGTQMGSMLEALAQTDVGKSVLSKVTGGTLADADKAD
ncbi:SPFH domain-containing protein [Methylophilus aquaticus]|uniref:SPFH domain-containing protein n=1 Tax=Methylophilus aquaticus TaxID=1971610 RepID=A0ABT9JSR7_9PROT|nr:SPFH domain-containing protein [Methylophilus aquaticus]MDP8567628.1 SPFH domain-containing protein [Methylophilus aquaticus]